MPSRVIPTTNAIETGVRDEGASVYARAAHNTTVTADPQVPGPGRSRPTPQNVATSVAHNGVRDNPGACSELTPATAGETLALMSGAIFVSEASFTSLRPNLRACSP